MFDPVLDRELAIVITIGTVYALIYLQMFKLKFVSKYVTIQKRKWKIDTKHVENGGIQDENISV